MVDLIGYEFNNEISSVPREQLIPKFQYFDIPINKKTLNFYLNPRGIWACLQRKAFILERKWNVPKRKANID